MIKKEGFNKSVYLEKANVPTIGYGFSVKIQKIIGKRIDSFETLSENQSREILSFLLSNKFAKLINKYDIIYCFNQNQYDALISFVYNIGNIDGLTNYGRRNKQKIGFKILEYINVKTDNGYIQSSGLIKKRKEENEYFNRPINRRPVYLEINHYDYCGPFYSILSNILSFPRSKLY